jgi:PAS domain S-box-containing protein
MKQQKLIQPILISFILALLIMTVTTFLSYRSNSLLTQAVKKSNDKYYFLISLKSILSDLQDVETGVRGYVITGEEHYLEPYNLALKKINPRFEQLRLNSAETEISRSSLDTLANLTTQMLTYHENLIGVRRERGLESARQITMTDQGKQIMDNIRAIIAGIQSRERAFLENNLQESHSIANIKNLQDISATVLSLVLFIFAFLLFYQQNNERKEYINVLKKTNERFSLLVDGVKDHALFLLDPEGRVSSWNSGAERLHGYNEEEVQNKHCSLFYTQDEVRKGKPVSTLQKATDLGHYEEEGWRIRKDGSRFWAGVLVTSLWDDNRNLTGYARLTRDLTEKKETEGKLQLRAEQQALIAKLGQQALESRDLDHLMEQIIHVVPDILNVDACNLWQLQPEANNLLFKKGSGWTEYDSLHADGDSQIAYTLKTNSAVVVENLNNEKRFSDQRLTQKYHIVSSLSVVIPGRDEPFGALGVYSRTRMHFSVDDINFVIAIANILATAINRIEDEKDLQIKEYAIASSLNGIALADLGGKLTYVNPAFLKMWGFDSEQEVIGRSSLEFWEEAGQAKKVINALEKQQAWRGELKAKRKDQSLFDTQLTTSMVKNQQGDPICFVASFQDISEQKKYQIALKKANRALKTISEFNQHMVRITDEQELLNTACNVVVDVGGYRLCWVGFTQNDPQKSIHPVAQRGFEDGYLETVKLSWADTDLGRGPSGTAIRTSKPVACMDIYTDPAYTPWREAASLRGFASSLSLPLISQNKVFGNLNIYAAEPNSFDHEEIKLLEELANDLAFGIMALRTREKQHETEQALLFNEARYRGLLESAPDGIIVMDEHGKIMLLNSQATRMFGYWQKEAEGKSINMLVPGILNHKKSARRKDYPNGFQVFNSGIDADREGVHKDGIAFPVEVSLSTMDNQGNRLITAIVRDISKRKEIEKNLKKSQEDLRHLSIHLINVREEEKKNISQQIHDEFGQQLTGFKMDIFGIKNQLQRADYLTKIPEVGSKLVYILEKIDNSIELVRKISTALHPSLLDHFGLVDAIEWHTQEFSKRTGIDCQISAGLGDLKLDKNKSIAIFRILQESLTNVARHAQASKVTVDIKQRRKQFILQIKDNGRGITREEINRTGSLGLLGIRERAIFLGGKMKISGTNAKGTKLLLEVPLEQLTPTPKN